MTDKRFDEDCSCIKFTITNHGDKTIVTWGYDVLLQHRDGSDLERGGRTYDRWPSFDPTAPPALDTDPIADGPIGPGQSLLAEHPVSEKPFAGTLRLSFVIYGDGEAAGDEAPIERLFDRRREQLEALTQLIDAVGALIEDVDETPRPEHHLRQLTERIDRNQPILPGRASVPGPSARAVSYSVDDAADRLAAGWNALETLEGLHAHLLDELRIGRLQTPEIATEARQ
ncbi:MAG: hypothetical protein AAGD38_11160 [Acidobacteriota bacterium]